MIPAFYIEIVAEPMYNKMMYCVREVLVYD